MNNPNVEDYLQNGIYGQKEIKPAERKKFLGTLRERVEGALTIGQVMKKEIYSEVKQWIQTNKDVQMLLNGNIDYSYLSKYTQLADQLKIRYTIVHNQEAETNVGLVITHPHAVEKESIWINESKEKKLQKKKSSSFFHKFIHFIKK
ncbi:uncharacterized protein YueI [Oikeobacillus pervagus]|uniref:Uncharacterized protein YueI n=1 Tax=Oikeobacillus pervagus TaxID=1325931 RepID=A0AAJ1T2Q7_9BACI|nr:YueI family protein [Oikeobacillus pervagus]MDQ0213785.1 uncharacterized protein YueI [Oikeobacillus pervagus]